jgi:serine/threonine protein kinase
MQEIKTNEKQQNEVLPYPEPSITDRKITNFGEIRLSNPANIIDSSCIIRYIHNVLLLKAGDHTTFTTKIYDRIEKTFNGRDLRIFNTLTLLGLREGSDAMSDLGFNAPYKDAFINTKETFKKLLGDEFNKIYNISMISMIHSFIDGLKIDTNSIMIYYLELFYGFEIVSELKPDLKFSIKMKKMRTIQTTDLTIVNFMWLLTQLNFFLRLNINHGDVKPDNIMVDGEGLAWFVDLDNCLCQLCGFTILSDPDFYKSGVKKDVMSVYKMETLLLHLIFNKQFNVGVTERVSRAIVIKIFDDMIAVQDKIMFRNKVIDNKLLMEKVKVPDEIAKQVRF